MRAVVQRVYAASVSIDSRKVSEIGKGSLILVGIAADDSTRDIEYIVSKTLNLRIFPDDDGVMNHSLVESGFSALVVSQFTLYGDTRKGRRPSYNRAASPDEARVIFQDLAREFSNRYPRVSFGEFQEMMKVTLINDGPVTLLIDSRKEF